MRIGTSLSLGTLCLLLAAAATAQGLYRHVDAKGRVTYSDQPPAAGTPVAPTRASAAESVWADLPYALRQVVQRYPATLYTGDDCSPCGDARTLLRTRGIPFEERTVSTAEDAAALQALSGQDGIPLLTLGNQQLKGFSDNVWGQYLDAAGYPRSSQLPPRYSNPPARPMVAVAPVTKSPRDTEPAGTAAATSTPPPASASPASNPAGIRF